MRSILRWSDLFLAVFAIAISCITPLALELFNWDHAVLQSISSVSGSVGGIVGIIAFLRIMNRDVKAKKPTTEGSPAVLGKIAERIDADTIQLWLKYENNLDLLLKFPELIRVNGAINTAAQSALSSLTAAREQYVAGTLSSAAYHKVASASKDQIKKSLHEARNIKDTAFLPHEREQILETRHQFKNGQTQLAENALLNMPYLLIPKGALGSTALGTAKTKRQITA